MPFMVIQAKAGVRLTTASHGSCMQVPRMICVTAKGRQGAHILFAAHR